MGDGDDRAVVLVEEALEPVDRLGVEVVRRLVEQQQVRVLEEEPCEGHAAPLAAGLSVVTSWSSGGQRSASIAMSTLRSRFQASAALILSSSADCSAPIAS